MKIINLVLIAILTTLSHGLAATSQPSPVVSGTTYPLTAVPSGVTATVSNASISVAWQANAEADLGGYNLYRNGVLYATLSQTTTNFLDSNCVAGTQYCYSLASFDVSGNLSVQSAGVCAALASPPISPTNLTVNVVSASELDLAWINISTNITGIQVFRGTISNGTFTLIATVPGTNTTYKNTGLTPNTTYYYDLEVVY